MLRLRKMDMSDIHFIVEEEMKIFGKTMSKKTLINEALYNTLAHYFIALLDDERVGYIGFWITEPNAELMNILVKKEVRSMGVGKHLMNKMFEVCKVQNVTDITLEVRVCNENAIAFYKAFDFDIVATRKQYYPNGDDAYLMRKQLGVII